MACLSCFSSWDAIQLQDYLILDADMAIPGAEVDAFLQSQSQPQPQQPPHLEEAPPAPTNYGLDHLDIFADIFLPPQEIFYPNPISDIFNVTQDLDSLFPTPKRQKLIDSSYQYNDLHHFPSSKPDFFNPYVNIAPEASIFNEFRGPDFPVAFETKGSDQNNGDCVKKPALSAQSVAARERRRRIAEKTQELGKLIPGGQKLNTAEMFQAAAKYVKFLQAQVGILQLMATMQSEENIYEERETGQLLASQAIQEKFSSEEVCLVPRKMVEVLSADEKIQKNPKISQDIDKLLSAN